MTNSAHNFLTGSQRENYRAVTCMQTRWHLTHMYQREMIEIEKMDSKREGGMNTETQGGSIL